MYLFSIDCFGSDHVVSVPAYARVIRVPRPQRSRKISGGVCWVRDGARLAGSYFRHTTPTIVPKYAFA